MKEPKCKVCGATDHYKYQCFSLRKKQIRPKRETILNWQQTVSKWKLANPPDKWGYWTCYLRISSNCLVRLDNSSLTLDHVVPRSSIKGIKRRHDITNLQPACWNCNGLKGSRSLEAIRGDHQPIGLIEDIADA